MNVLIVGSGGREHALAWKLAQSPLIEKLYVAPGNPGTAEIAINVPIHESDFTELEDFCEREQVEMIVVGPEAPLVAGIADYFDGKPVKVVGPESTGARLEGSKAYSKTFLQRYGVPTARHATFSMAEVEQARAYLAQHPLPVVLKVDGLAAGKGVVVTSDKAEAEAFLNTVLVDAKFGTSGNKLVIEEFLDGVECSVFILTDGKDYQLLPMAKDYKRVGDGDTGPNTGGMGAVSPVPFVDRELRHRIRDEVILPTLKGMQAENMVYRGFLYIGLMIVKGTPYVLEFNVRMGDPETQAVLPRIQSDLLVLFNSLFDGTLAQHEIAIHPATTVTVVCASGGYPATADTGHAITGLDLVGDALVFHAGTTRNADGQLVNKGGRVFAVTAYGEGIPEAAAKAQAAAAQVQFQGRFFRSDIGQDLLRIQQV
jgi:phosphoribosylamine--glycine ligase